MKAVRPVSADRKVLYDSQGNRYVAEFTGAWDPPLDDERVGCYYEDENRPKGAVKLYRLTKVKPTRMERFARVLSTGGLSLLEGGREGR